MSNPDRDQLEIIAGFDLERRRDDKIIQRCLTLCSLFNVSGDDLVNSWLAYAFNNKINDGITLPYLDSLERYLHEETQKRLHKETLSTPKTSSMTLLRSRNVVSPVVTTQTQRLSSSFPSQLDAALSVTVKPLAKIASPAPKSRSSVQAAFMSPSILGSPAEPSKPWAQRTNRGRVIQALNLELNEFTEVSREDRAALPIQCELDIWAGKFRYMFQPDDIVDQLKEQREDSILEEILSEQFHGATLDALNPLNTPSASETIFGGIIMTYNSSSKIHITDTWLCRRNQRVLLTLPTDDMAEWGFFPGMICVLKGFNPTGNNLLVKEVHVPKPIPSPTRMLTDGTPPEISVMFAAGPFTFGDDRVYSPLGEFLDEVSKRAPTLLILSGPFIDVDNETQTPKTFTELREELWNFITAKLKDTETRVVTVPHIREAHHVACFPQPNILKSQQFKMDQKIVHLPNPCVFSIGDVKFCVMNHDIIFHLAGNEISKTVPGSQANRVARLCSYLLRQRSLYPLMLPPANASIDWTHLRKFCLDSAPDLIFLPSQLGQFVRTAENSVFVNAGHLVKGIKSPGTFARVVIHSGPSPIHQRTRVEIVRI